MNRWFCRSEEETVAIGRALASELEPDGVLLLTGDLGAGKTVLVRGVAEGLGLDPREIQSPTFTIVREHEREGRRLVHVDLYRLDSRDAEAIGLEEILNGAGVKVVEWAERLSFSMKGARQLQIRRGTGESERRIEELPSETPRGERRGESDGN
jgi:tRNA threonylcarbamoyladenosine biosynthesis protein TsaE